MEVLAELGPAEAALLGWQTAPPLHVPTGSSLCSRSLLLTAQVSSSDKDTSQMGLRLSLMTSS